MKRDIIHPTARRVFSFYWDGFKNLSSWGRSVWIVILIKLFVIFAVIRIFFMPDFLKKNFTTDQERGQHVLENLTGSQPAKPLTINENL